MLCQATTSLCYSVLACMCAYSVVIQYLSSITFATSSDIWLKQLSEYYACIIYLLLELCPKHFCWKLWGASCENSSHSMKLLLDLLGKMYESLIIIL